MVNNVEYRVLFYETESGKCPAEAFLSTLPVKIRAKTAKWIEKLQEYGPNLPRPYADVVQGKIRELRVIFSSNHYRFLYFFWGKNIIITHGFIKKSSRVPEDEIEKARNSMADFEARLKKGDITI